MTKYPIYLDFNATTPVHPIVLEAMLPFFGTDYESLRVLTEAPVPRPFTCL